MASSEGTLKTLKTAKRRGTQVLMQKMGVGETTTDAEFDENNKRCGGGGSPLRLHRLFPFD
jgi:hypothetical protein